MVAKTKTILESGKIKVATELEKRIKVLWVHFAFVGKYLGS